MKLINKEFINAISFGINEQVMTILAAVGGLSNKTKNNLIGLLIIFSFASSLPDVYTYIASTKSKNRIFGGITVFLAEMICVFIIAIPLLLFKKKILMMLGTFILGILIIIFNELIIKNSSSEDTIMSCLMALFFTIIAYFVSKLVTKIFNLKD